MKRKPGASRSKRKISRPRKSAGVNHPKTRRASRRGREAGAGGFLSISPAKLAAKLTAQRVRRKAAIQKGRAVVVRNKFRPRKADRGNFVLVGTDGKRNPEAKGRKGYLVYVTKGGKKQLAGYKQDYRPRRITEIEPPAYKNRLAPAKRFQAARRVTVASGKPAVKARGTVPGGRGQSDFSEGVVRELAKGVRAGMMRQASRRTFILSVMVWVELPDGSSRVFDVQVPIARRDHDAIELGGIENFIRQKFYAFMARELQVDGFVTRGSANHIRRMADNQGKDISEWTQPDGEKWRGNESEVVQIKTMEWKLEQAK